MGPVAKVCLQSEKEIQSSHLWVEKVLSSLISEKLRFLCNRSLNNLPIAYLTLVLGLSSATLIKCSDSSVLGRIDLDSLLLVVGEDGFITQALLVRESL